MNDHQLGQKVENHDARLVALENGVLQVVDSLKVNTTAVNELVKELAVNTAKHDETLNQLAELKESQKETNKTVVENSKAIAAMQPVVEGMRGFVWKIVGYTLTATVGASTAAIGIFSYISK